VKPDTGALPKFMVSPKHTAWSGISVMVGNGFTVMVSGKESICAHTPLLITALKVVFSVKLPEV